MRTAILIASFVIAEAVSANHNSIGFKLKNDEKKVFLVIFLIAITMDVYEFIHTILK